MNARRFKYGSLRVCATLNRGLWCTALLVASGACACDTPVYWWALENWPPSPCEATVFHKGPLGPEARKAVDALKAATKTLNLEVVMADLDGEVDAPCQALWKAQKNAVAPWVVVAFPAQSSERPLWTGALADLPIQALADSPVRARLAKRLVEGTPGAWVLLESGKKEDDARAVKVLEERLKSGIEEVRKDLKERLAETADEGKTLLAGLSVTLERVSPSDPAERFFARMLTEHDEKIAAAAKEKPQAFLLFGRGRMIGPLAGEELSAAGIDAALGFLTGPCMCEIKAQNPGLDMLIKADWDQMIWNRDQPKSASLPAAAPLTPAAIAPPEMPVLSAAPPDATPASDPGPAPAARLMSTGNAPAIGMLEVSLVGAGILVIALSLWVRRRQ